jgi:hypothetical protein
MLVASKLDFQYFDSFSDTKARMLISGAHTDFLHVID